MAFGQQLGPPAPARQVQELLELLRRAGHQDFRDARGPMGFTQRQAAGKFTAPEAAAFIDRLLEAEHAGTDPVAAAPAERLSAAEQALRRLPAEQLAAELQRRGWIVIEP
jgi:formate-dependent phosphoribosylglycinamide formyltransferase (GAR transformylase)